jgi:hypothetical protein
LAQIRPDEAHNHIKGGSFPSTVRSKQTDNFTLPYLDADLIDHPPVFIGFDQFIRFETLHSFL